MTHILELQSLTSDTYEEIEAAISSLSFAACTGSSTLSVLLCKGCCDRLGGTADAEFAQYLDHYTPTKNDIVRAHRVLTSASLTDYKQQVYELLTV